jgi:hypothetical protein
MTEAYEEPDFEDFSDDESDEFKDAMYDCHGYFDQPGLRGVFHCGAIGSEDCDECPCYRWIGLTNRQIDELPEDPP